MSQSDQVVVGARGSRDSCHGRNRPPMMPIRPRYSRPILPDLVVPYERLGPLWAGVPRPSSHKRRNGCSKKTTMKSSGYVPRHPSGKLNWPTRAGGASTTRTDTQQGTRLPSHGRQRRCRLLTGLMPSSKTRPNGSDLTAPEPQPDPAPSQRLHKPRLQSLPSPLASAGPGGTRVQQ